jgi:hypothetical protein
MGVLFHYLEKDKPTRGIERTQTVMPAIPSQSDTVSFLNIAVLQPRLGC